MPRTPDIHPYHVIVSQTCFTFRISGDRAHRVIAKEDTAKCGKSAHEIRFDGDWCLDPIDIGRARHRKSGNSASRHDGGWDKYTLLEWEDCAVNLSPNASQRK